VSGVAAQSFLDKQTGFRDAGFGLDIVDWIMEPGSDEAYRDRLTPELVYHAGNLYHGKGQKRSIEGPQICTQAKELSPKVIRGKDFVAVVQSYRYRTAAPGKKTGSTWTQTLVFPAGKRYFVSSDRIDAVNSSDAMFLRIDMPGHIKHNRGDTFSHIYLSYYGKIPAAKFFNDFAPDEQFNFRRDRDGVPQRFIRAYQVTRPKASAQPGAAGPWLAGMTLDPAMPSEAWCHQRGYVCMIEEFGERPVRAGESFSAAFVVGYFDSIDEMNQVYDRYRGASGLEVSPEGWKFTYTAKPRYVSADVIDAIALLPAPPAADSGEARAERDLMVALQERRTEGEVARCRSEVIVTLNAFTRVMCPWFTEENLPRLAKLLDHAEKDTKTFSNAAKYHFQRKRPAGADPRIKPAVENENTPSYPSGHATRGIVFATVIAQLAPDQKAALFDRGREIGWDRVIAGMHHPSDIIAGRVLGQAVARALLHSPKFQEDLAAARAEFDQVRREKARTSPAPAAAN
jgi:hypothetical protein